MSALGGAIGVGLALVVEQILLGNKNSPAAVTGIFGTVTKVVAAAADPGVPGIPDLRKPKS